MLIVPSICHFFFSPFFLSRNVLIFDVSYREFNEFAAEAINPKILRVGLFNFLAVAKDKSSN